jgi:hypothetical protein
MLSYTRGRPACSRVLGQNSRYTDDTQSVGSFVFLPAIYRALRCDRATGALQLQRDPMCQRPFTAVTRVQIPSGTPNLINELREFPQKLAVQRRYNLGLA